MPKRGKQERGRFRQFDLEIELKCQRRNFGTIWMIEPETIAGLKPISGSEGILPSWNTSSIFFEIMEPVGVTESEPVQLAIFGG
jgi:hypothetical protein